MWRVHEENDWKCGVKSLPLRERHGESFRGTYISSPESTFLLVSTKNTDSAHFQGRNTSRTSGSSTQAQKFETTVVVNGYKNGPSLRLRIKCKWPESVFLVLTKRKED